MLATWDLDVIWRQVDSIYLYISVSVSTVQNTLNFSRIIINIIQFYGKICVFGQI